MDNRDVVPYNPGLSKKYASHVNVEVVKSIKSVKYIYKYIQKDMTALLSGAGKTTLRST